MKEILYIQAGRLSNHIGTHFWNAQQSYFTYGENAEEPIVEHDVSFREGMNLQGEPTFCPRLLLFDRKSNFGAIPDLYGLAESEDATKPWNGSVVEYRQEPIHPSEYHSQLAAVENQKDTEGSGTKPDTDQPKPNATARYWSDYSLADYHPRSLQRLPDVPEWEDTDGNWIVGRQTFDKFDEDTDLMEGAFRTFVEECDNLQGVQIMNDTVTFGSFVNSFLTRFRDDFAKLPCLSFSVLSEQVPSKIDTDDSPGIKQALNDAFCIQGLCELVTINVPLQDPLRWYRGRWLNGVTVHDNVYQTSAILSTHIESITLPLRLKRLSEDLSSLCSVLNWRNNTPLAQLSGIFPFSNQLPTQVQFEQPLYDFSASQYRSGTHTEPKTTFARFDVSRGFSRDVIKSYDGWVSQIRPLPRSIHSPAINLPSSFPPLADATTTDIRALSCVQTTSRSSSIFAAYASLANDCLTKHADVVARMGLEMDDVKDLRERMWTLEDNYKQDDGGIGSDDAGLGEDEEF